MNLSHGREYSIVPYRGQYYLRISSKTETSTAEVFSVVQKEGSRTVTRNVTCYSLEVVIAVGHRENSERGAQFRQWAISILQHYIHKGFVLDGDRFKYGSRFSIRHFDDLLEEIRDIHSSERMMYQMSQRI
jgi:hypothetical protein